MALIRMRRMRRAASETFQVIARITRASVDDGYVPP